jgi:hypothetical protein
MIIPDGYAGVQIPALHGGSGREALITFGVQDQANVLVPSAIAEDIWTVFAAELLPLLDSEVTWGPIRVRRGTAGDELVGEGTSSAAGGSAIASVPPNCAVLVTKGSGLSGRKNRGRYYWPWAATEGSVTELGVWDSGAVANFQSGQSDFLDGIDSANLPMVILHNVVGTPTPVQSLTVQALLGTQRRRMRS